MLAIKKYNDKIVNKTTTIKISTMTISTGIAAAKPNGIIKNIVGGNITIEGMYIEQRTISLTSEYMKTPTYKTDKTNLITFLFIWLL